MLSIEQIEFVSIGMKEDLQRRANQGILRKDFNRALEALSGIATVDDMLYRLRIRDDSLLGMPNPMKRGRGRPRNEPRRIPEILRRKANNAG